jgi:lipopolysaccharide transport system ATP-binding protein
MNDIAVRTEALSKQFHIGRKIERHPTLRDALTAALAAPFHRAGKLLRGHASAAAGLNETLWALRNISLEIRRGEVVGIIGRNGAGKSTLLKILSRITEPTEGFAETHGQVGALLEVGTGFHPELTGRENIYLNGAILGMKRVGIDCKFDEIVAFAEVERFIDTPVKHYSSGMRLRLGFAVSAYLEPEILIVDEVLAVGDARFQKKCLSKMQDVGRGGRTVLFVSHNMPAITRLCERAILLEEGRVLQDGASGEVVMGYLAAGLGTTAAREWTDPAKAPGSEIARLCAVRVRAEGGQVSDIVDIARPFAVEIEYHVLKSGYVLMPNFHFYNEEGLRLFPAYDLDPEWRRRPRPAGHYVTAIRIPGNMLSEGTLFVGAGVQTSDPVVTLFYQPDAVAFRAVAKPEANWPQSHYSGRQAGVVSPILKWTTQSYPNDQTKGGTVQEHNDSDPAGAGTLNAHP